MKTITAKPAGMALNGIAEGLARGRHQGPTTTLPQQHLHQQQQQHRPHLHQYQQQQHFQPQHFHQQEQQQQQGQQPQQQQQQQQQQHQHQQLRQQSQEQRRHHLSVRMQEQESVSGSVPMSLETSTPSSSSSLEDEPPVFRAYMTPPPDQSVFSFPVRPDRTSAEFDMDPQFPHLSSAPRYPDQEPDPRYQYQETTPKQVYQETEPKQVYQETEPKRVYQETEPKRLYQDLDPSQSRSETSARFPYPDTDPPGPLRPQTEASSGEPRFPYPGSSSEPPPSSSVQESERQQPAARRLASSRRYSEAGSPRPRWLHETARSQSEEACRLPAGPAGPLPGVLPEDACLDSDETGSISVSSDMRGLQAHVHESSHVHVGPKVFDQRNIHVARLDSHVGNLHRHEHVQEKHEHIQSKHEHVRNKTEVHNRTENIKHEHIQNKHEHIQVNRTEIVHNKTKAIYAGRVHVHYDCKHDPAAMQSPPPSPSPLRLEVQRPFLEGYRFLATRYKSWTTLSTPLPWYDEMVLDISKSCIDFSMVSMGGSSSSCMYSSLEELVHDQQQPGKALRVIVEGHAGYGKTTLAAKVAFDWANGAGYLKRFSHAFLIYLRELRGSLDEHIKTLHYPQELPDADAFLHYLKTNQERVLFIFDGYDELPKEQRSPIDQIMSGRAFVHSGAVMTSRPMSMAFKKYCQYVSLVGFDDTKKAEFVRLVYRDRPLMRTDQFLAVLERDRCVSELAQCPLMCLLLCEMHQRGKVGTGATKSHVYQELFHYLIGKAVHRRHPQPMAEESARLAATYHEALAAFGSFCLQCLASDQLTFRQSDIPDSVNAARLFEIGFIVKCRNFSSNMCTEAFYEPIHKTFLEFLAAQYLRSIIGEEERLKRELLRLRQGTSRASERLILQYLCGLLKAEAWTIMDHLDVDDVGFGRDFLFSLLREAGESPQNVAAVCRRLPQDRVMVRGSDNHLAVWALCLSSPASEVSELEFIWEVAGSGRAGALAEFVSAQLGFWSALQSCANITDLRVTFVYGESSDVPAAFLDAMCECMKHCARLTRLAVLHVKAIASDSGADTFLPVVVSLSQHVRSCASLHRLTIEMNLSSRMAERLCAGLAHVPRLQTLRLPRLYCDAAGFAALAELIRQHISIKTLDVSVVLVDGMVDLASSSYSQLNREAIVRNKKVSSASSSLEQVQKIPLHRAGPSRQRNSSEQLRTRSCSGSGQSSGGGLRTGPDQELEHLKDVLAVNLKDERRVRVVEGIWYLVDQAGSRGLYPLPMCDRMSHKGGYHQLLEAVRCRGGRLEHLTIGRQSLTKMDFVCLGETIRKSESLTHLTLVDVAKAVNVFPLITALPTTKRLESVVLRSQQVQVNDFLFSVFCRCLEHNTSLQELNIQQWKFQLECAASMEHLRTLMKNTSLKRLVLAECRVWLSCRVDEPAVFPCASLSCLDLANCSVEVASGAVLRGAALLPLLQGLSALKQLDLSDKAAPPLNDAAVKAFFAGLSGFKTLQELAIRGWRYDVANPEAAYADTKAAARKWGRLTTVRIDKSQFTARSTECSKQWLVQAVATGVPHLQELSFAGLATLGPLRCALTAPQLDQLAKAIAKAKWTGHALRLCMPQLDARLVDTFVELTAASSRIDVTSDGRTVLFKRSRGAQWWPLRTK